MYLKRTILACLLVAASPTLLADQLRLKAGYPESYVVQKGDTLWDISGKYLSEPWLWPVSGISTLRLPIPTGSTRVTCCN